MFVAAARNLGRFDPVQLDTMARRLAIVGVGGVILVGISLALVAVAGRSLYSRAAFGTWDPNALPERISYCDRRYQPGSRVTRANIESTGNAFGVFPIREVARTADGKPIVAKPLPESVRRMYPNGPPLPCSMSVYVQVGANDYVGYGIEGGP
jgi:hypothetical protein